MPEHSFIFIYFSPFWLRAGNPPALRCVREAAACGWGCGVSLGAAFKSPWCCLRVSGAALRNAAVGRGNAGRESSR